MSVRFGSTWFFALAELAGIIGIVGCASPRLRLDVDAEPPGASFRKVRDRWTRDGALTSITEMDTALLVTATLRSPGFQHAYTERYLKLYAIQDPAERSRVTQSEQQLAESGLNFWVRTSTHSDKWNDFRPQHGRWRIVLVDDQGGEMPAEQITPVVRGEGLEVVLFDERPDVYSHLWHVRFPPPSPQTPGLNGKQRKLTLRFAGPAGKTDLVWLLE
jgi:hypothetical protein